jgi:hypothetical protein
MSHTPEPWIVAGDGAFITSTASADLRRHWNIRAMDTGRHYGGDIALANARRIVACVNACAGIETSIIEQNTNKVSDLLNQRDELLAFANTVKEYAEKYPHDTGLYDLVVGELKKLEPQS